MEKQKEPTREEKRKNEIDSLESTLKNSFYLSVLGSNTLRDEASFYGTLAKGVGEAQYSASMKSESAGKLRQDIYNATMEEEEKARANLGIADMPDVPYPTNYQLTKYVLSIINQSLDRLPLANLENLLGEKGVKLEIPNELKQYESKREELIMKAHEQKKTNKEIIDMLNKEDKDSEAGLYHFRELVHETMKSTAAYKLLESHRYDHINNRAEAIAKAYRKAKGIKEPEKPKEAEGKAGKK
jgi:hypothetical protein